MGEVLPADTRLTLARTRTRTRTLTRTRTRTRTLTLTPTLTPSLTLTAGAQHLLRQPAASGLERRAADQRQAEAL